MVKDGKIGKLKLRNWSQKMKDLAGVISAALVIGGALIGGGRWLLTEINASTNARVDALEQKIDATNESNKMAIYRLELLSLIQTDPDNVVEIERVGKDYFSAGGDYYMSSVFSRWAQEHGADATFVIRH